MKAVTFRTGRLVCAAFVVMLCLGAGSAALSQSNNRSTISGFVFDPDRRPIPDAWVELLNEVNSLVQRVRTNSSGRFFFSGLSQGRFTIRVLSMTSGLESRPEDVEIAGIGVTGRQLADNVQRDIYMYRRKSDTEVDQLTGVLYAQNVPADAQAAYKKALDDINEAISSYI